MSAAARAVDLHAKPSPQYSLRLAEAQSVLSQAAAQYAPTRPGRPSTVVQASSLGAEDIVISHLINQLHLDIGIFVLDTGQLHPQTLELLERFSARSRAPVAVYRPADTTVVEFVRREGPEAMYKSVALRKACCGVRKLEPLSRALADKDAWITGLRREQSGNRADVLLVDHTEVRTKISPLANWSWGDVWHTIREHRLDYNPLHDAFYPSIGCAPCTRAISLGEDWRAGRWWWEDEAAKECGLHTKGPAPATKDHA